VHYDSGVSISRVGIALLGLKNNANKDYCGFISSVTSAMITGHWSTADGQR